MTNAIAGIDHVIVGVRDLERARAGWSRLGFTLSPRVVRVQTDDPKMGVHARPQEQSRSPRIFPDMTLRSKNSSLPTSYCTGG